MIWAPPYVLGARPCVGAYVGWADTNKGAAVATTMAEVKAAQDKANTLGGQWQASLSAALSSHTGHVAALQAHKAYEEAITAARTLILHTISDFLYHDTHLGVYTWDGKNYQDPKIDPQHLALLQLWLTGDSAHIAALPAERQALLTDFAGHISLSPNAGGAGVDPSSSAAPFFPPNLFPPSGSGPTPPTEASASPLPLILVLGALAVYALAPALVLRLFRKAA